MESKNWNNHVIVDEDDVQVDLDIRISVRFSRKDHPEGKMIPVAVDGKEEFILIPIDIKDGATIKVSGRGKHNARTGKTGDLYVYVAIEDKKFPWNNALIIIALSAIVLACGIFMITQRTEKPSDRPFIEPQNTVESPMSCTHTWIAANCTTAKTCSSCGITDGTPVGHLWREATYNEAQKCSVCGATEGESKTPSSPLNLRTIIKDVYASSVYAGDRLTHFPENLYDGKLDTNWTEDNAGNGIGEYIHFQFDDTYAVKKLHIYIGSHFNEGVYKQNCRPRTISLTFSDGSMETFRLEDTYDEQIIVFDQYYYTDSIKLTIEDVYTGSKYLDTIIAELDFIVYRP